RVEVVEEIVLALPDETRTVMVELDALRADRVVGSARVLVEARAGEAVELSLAFRGMNDPGERCEPRPSECVSSDVLRRYGGERDPVGT
ncbi:MAG: hypothetical protein AAF645_06575, partial [Myxococcota bacterium]